MNAPAADEPDCGQATQASAQVPLLYPVFHALRTRVAGFNGKRVSEKGCGLCTFLLISTVDHQAASLPHRRVLRGGFCAPGGTGAPCTGPAAWAPCAGSAWAPCAGPANDRRIAARRIAFTAETRLTGYRRLLRVLLGGNLGGGWEWKRGALWQSNAHWSIQTSQQQWTTFELAVPS